MYYFKSTTTPKSIINFKNQKNMKLKSLFLASLAALAMVSCSNENDPAIDGGVDNAEKNALLNLGFAFPKSAVTRAETEAGSEAEYEFENIAIIIDYQDPNKEAKREVKILDRAAFSPATVAANSNNVVIYTKESIHVTKGTATIHAILNTNYTESVLLNPMMQDLSAQTFMPGKYEALNALTINGPATDGKFMMTNTTEGISATFIENKATDVTIPMNRVVAKLMETSETRVFKNVPLDYEPATTGLVEKLHIVLKKATYVNLAKKTSLFPSETAISTDWFQGYPMTWNTLPANNGNFEYIDLTSDARTHYCFENESESTHTGIIYEAVATWDEKAAQTFYIYGGKIYLDYAALKEKCPGCPEKTATSKDFHEKDIRKYVDGKCYYYKDIQTTTETGSVPKIQRNNVYKISVSSVVKIGTPTIIFEDPETLMNVSIEVDPWTVNDNSLTLE